MNQPQVAQIEYTIYTFDLPVMKTKGDISWKKHSTINDMSAAISAAEDLLKTRKFQKIEVKKKFFDPKQNRPVDMTLKVLKNSPANGWRRPFHAACAVMGIGATFAAAYLLTVIL